MLRDLVKPRALENVELDCDLEETENTDSASFKSMDSIIDDFSSNILNCNMEK